MVSNRYLKVRKDRDIKGFQSVPEGKETRTKSLKHSGIPRGLRKFELETELCHDGYTNKDKISY